MIMKKELIGNLGTRTSIYTMRGTQKKEQSSTIIGRNVNVNNAQIGKNGISLERYTPEEDGITMEMYRLAPYRPHVRVHIVDSVMKKVTQVIIAVH